MKALQAEWKTIGPCGKEADEALWQRFRAATQSFFERRAAAFQDRDREEQENLRRKEELCAAAEALTYAADPVAATEEAKILQAEWKTIGPVRRDRADALWARFRAACDTIFENAAAERARRRTAWEQKLHDALARKREQLYRLRESISLDERKPRSLILGPPNRQTCCNRASPRFPSASRKNVSASKSWRLRSVIFSRSSLARSAHLAGDGTQADPETAVATFVRHVRVARPRTTKLS
ncbi:MAG: hypothetical protein C4346_13925 [Chloroflexota bacterium]